MPANLTPMYLKAEEAYRKAKTIDEKIAALEDMLALIPKHKGTDKMQADIKRRLSQARAEKQRRGKSGGQRKDPFHVPPSGGGQVALMGLPNVGKTSLVNALAGTDLKVADYPFTTQVPAPGMAKFEDAPFQLLDMPPVTEDGAPGGMIGALRRADILLLVLDLGREDLLEQLEVLEGILERRGIVPVPWGCSRAREAELEVGFAKSALIVATKRDLDGGGNVEVLEELYEGDLEIVPVSVQEGEVLERLKERLYRMLDVIRVYSKQPGKKADMEEPFLIPKGSTIGQLAELIHKELPKQMKFARVWGPSAKFDGQQLQQNHVLMDRDIVEIHV
ncbi:MAG: TGS domain-containing protein [Planctomycetota bacterium]|nr:MAG: TGS domain-containing protein [Planctomycetota bacterium]